MSLGKVGVIGRFKPFHLGAAVMLEAICEQAEQVVIGIRSSNKYNARNPFTAAESREMVDAVLSPRFSNYEVVEVPDFGHIPEYSDGSKWKEYVIEHFGKLDNFISGNGYVKDLLSQDYPIIHPASLIQVEKQVYIRAAMVRMEMAKGGNWKSLVPEQVAAYLESKGLVERFRKEFGLETLGQLTDDSYARSESSSAEKRHAGEP